MNKELSVEEQVTKDCPILFKMRHRPCSETTMCWGFECGEGWHDVIASACRELEMLNIEYYPKYRVRIQADQIKEKFGTLHFYWSVAVDPNRFFTWLSNKLERAYDFLDNAKRFDYKIEKIVDVAPYDYDDKKELTKEEYDNELNSKIKCTNVTLSEANGKYFKTIHCHNYGKCHFSPTRLKALWRIKEFCNKLKCIIPYYFTTKQDAKVRNCMELLERKAFDIVHKAEKDCAKHCEDCGTQIGTEWSPACMTTGWIRYICDGCAKKHTGNYIKNGELWSGDKMLKTKEEMEANKKSNLQI